MSKNAGCSPGKKIKQSLDRRVETVIAQPYKVIIGVDEAGRGPLCGPVVAAACLIPNHDDLVLHGIMDSKKLTDEKERDEIYECLISDSRVMWCTSIVSNHEIDSINILQASLAAMKRATIGLLEKYKISDTSTFVALIDGNKTPVEMPMASKCVIKGDSLMFSIAAASIIAKVTRDRIMHDLDKKYPLYGLAKHKGYPTASHRSALYEHGPCEIYRMSYAPVKLAAEMMAKKSGAVSAANCCKELDASSSVEVTAVETERSAKQRRRSDEVLAKRVEKRTKSTFEGESLLSKKKIKIADVTEGLMGGKRTRITTTKAKENDSERHSLRRSARLITRLEHT